VPVDRFRVAESYTPPSGGGSGKSPGEPAVGRAIHGQTLGAKLGTAVQLAQQNQAAATAEVDGAEPGLYLEFESFPGWELAVEHMGHKTKHIEVVAVSRRAVEEEGQETFVEVASVFVPDGKVGHFIDQIDKYTNQPPRTNESTPERVYNRVADLRLATLKALWTDDITIFPDTPNTHIWWEVWLRFTDGEEVARFRSFAEQSNIRLGPRQLRFNDRTVVLAYATPSQLAASLDVLGDLAELQRAKETAAFFVSQYPADQMDWVDDLRDRTTPAPADAPAVCVLDTGVNRGHPLLEASLSEDDCHTINPKWGPHDHHGHGTQMAGLALYGDLVPALESAAPVPLLHQLESVKFLPPTGDNEPDLYGAITAEAVGRPEVEAVDRSRVFSMAVTTDDSRDRGAPTSWSAAVDALAAGRSFDADSGGLLYFDDVHPQRRLFVVSAGNVSTLDPEHLERSDTESIQDPAHAWNALTVGAYTNKVTIGDDPEWNGWTPVAERGELSPWSTTSLTFTGPWPIKPEVVLEGGNVVKNEAGESSFPCDDLNLLGINFKPAEKLFETVWGTSAATAQAARQCAIIRANYPALWPETVRALMVHSARWTPAMQAHFDGAGTKTNRGRLVRRYGYGVPSLPRALLSAGDAVTLIVQDTIHPFRDKRMNEIHVHDLPWPTDVLADLGEAPVRLRVTLSYFVEPNPGRRGWRTKHRYQSHGLRFDVKGETESIDEFRKRINKAALDDGETKPKKDRQAGDWWLGPNVRDAGSLHSDLLVGLTAADLAERSAIAVYPVTGWWKESKRGDRSEQGARYALVVSIETDAEETDLWTPVATRVGIPVEVVVG
jgi:hypothetical protein